MKIEPTLPTSCPCGATDFDIRRYTEPVEAVFVECAACETSCASLEGRPFGPWEGGQSEAREAREDAMGWEL